MRNVKLPIDPETAVALDQAATLQRSLPSLHGGRREGAGQKPTPGLYTARYQASPDGTQEVKLKGVPNRDMAFAEREGAARGMSAQAYMRKLLADAARESQFL